MRKKNINLIIVLLTLLSMITQVIAMPMLEPSDTNIFNSLEQVFSGEKIPEKKPPSEDIPLEDLEGIVPPEILDEIKLNPELTPEEINCMISPHVIGLTLGAFGKVLLDVSLAFGGMFLLNKSYNDWQNLQKVDVMTLPVDVKFPPSKISSLSTKEELVSYGLLPHDVDKLSSLFLEYSQSIASKPTEKFSIPHEKLTPVLPALLDIFNVEGYAYEKKEPTVTLDSLVFGDVYGQDNPLTVATAKSFFTRMNFSYEKWGSHFPALRARYGVDYNTGYTDHLPWDDIYSMHGRNSLEFDSFVASARAKNANICVISVSYDELPDSNYCEKSLVSGVIHKKGLSAAAAKNESISFVPNVPNLLLGRYSGTTNYGESMTYRVTGFELFFYTDTNSKPRIEVVDGTIPGQKAIKLSAVDGSTVHLFREGVIPRYVNSLSDDVLTPYFQNMPYYRMSAKAFGFPRVFGSGLGGNNVKGRWYHTVPYYSSSINTGALPPAIPLEFDKPLVWPTNLDISQNAVTNISNGTSLLDVLDRTNTEVVDNKQMVINGDPVLKGELDTIIRPDPEPDVKPDPKPDPNPDVKPDPKPDPNPDVTPDWTWWQWLKDWCSKVWDWMQNLVPNIWEGFKELMLTLFVPKDGYFTDSFGKFKDEIAAAFGYLDWGKLETTLTGAKSNKPDFSVIVFGQKVQLIDLSFWEKYKNILQGLIFAVVGCLMFLYNIRMVQYLIRSSDSQHQSPNVFDSSKGGRFL